MPSEPNMHCQIYCSKCRSRGAVTIFAGQFNEKKINIRAPKSKSGIYLQRTEKYTAIEGSNRQWRGSALAFRRKSPATDERNASHRKTAATGKVFFLQRGNNACSRQSDRPRLQSFPSKRKVADGYYGIRAFRREGISIPYD